MTCSVGAAMAVMRHDTQCQRFSSSFSMAGSFSAGVSALRNGLQHEE